MADQKIIVETSLGKLAGYEYTTARGDIIYTFEGIPYAKPPVGDLRFKSPVPVEKWEGVKEATKPGNVAPFFSYLIPGQAFYAGDEDCLHLSVYTPQKPRPGLKLPVMVWIHGGGFTMGSGIKDSYGPDYLSPYGVILVSINYRLGPFGFLSLQTPECPGNYGLKDQNLGLRWVKDHIGSFGGDPDNVTLFGESAGGASVHYQVLSPRSKGLFQRAIAMSAAATNRWAYSRHSRQSALLLAQNLGCTSEDQDAVLETLRKASTEDILKSTVGIFEKVEGLWPGEQILCFPFVPTAEPEGTPDPFITRHPREMVASGDFNDVPYVTGITDSECSFILPTPDFIPPDEDDYYEKLLLKELEPELGSANAKEAARRLRKFYFPNGPTQEGMVQALSATVFCYGVGKAAQAVAKKKKCPTYLYVFTGQREVPHMNKFFGITYPGTAHAYELEFLWHGTFVPTDPQNPIEPGTKESKISENICKLWTDFAKSGKFGTDWPIVEDESQLPYLHISEELEVKKQFLDGEMELWDDISALLKK